MRDMGSFHCIECYHVLCLITICNQRSMMCCRKESDKHLWFSRKQLVNCKYYDGIGRTPCTQQLTNLIQIVSVHQLLIYDIPNIWVVFYNKLVLFLCLIHVFISHFNSCPVFIVEGTNNASVVWWRIFVVAASAPAYICYVFQNIPYNETYCWLPGSNPHLMDDRQNALKRESCHDANFVVTGAAQVVVTTTCAAAIDDKVGIMITFGLQFVFY